jgi:hypothetical protein
MLSKLIYTYLKIFKHNINLVHLFVHHLEARVKCPRIVPGTGQRPNCLGKDLFVNNIWTFFLSPTLVFNKTCSKLYNILSAS